MEEQWERPVESMFTTIELYVHNISAFRYFCVILVLNVVFIHFAVRLLSMFMKYFGPVDSPPTIYYVGRRGNTEKICHLVKTKVEKDFKKDERLRKKYRNKVVRYMYVSLLVFFTITSAILLYMYSRGLNHDPSDVCRSKQCLRSAANLAISMDTSADPCDDFYQYVCGNWVQEHPRPDAYSSYDWFRIKQLSVHSSIRDVLARNLSWCPPPVQQAKLMYDGCVDLDHIESKGLEPVKEKLKDLTLPPYPSYLAVPEEEHSEVKVDWVQVVVNVKTMLGMDVLIGFEIFNDPKNSSVYRLAMGTPGTTNPFPSMHNEKKKHKIGKKAPIPILQPNRPTSFHQIFLKHNGNGPLGIDKKTKSISADKTKEVYINFYKFLFAAFSPASGNNTIDYSEAEKAENAAEEYYALYNTLYELENINATDEVDLDYYENYPEYTADEIQARTDAVLAANNESASPIWKRYLEGVFAVSKTELDFATDKIMVSDVDMEYMEKMALLMARTPAVDIELYIWVKVVEVMSVHTTSALRERFEAAYEALQGRGGRRSRSLQCAALVTDMMGLAVAHAILDEKFVTVSKPKLKKMLNELKNGLAHLVGLAKWMDDDTKLATYEKIERMKSLIGFPEWMLQNGKLEEYYQGLKINPETHLENMINVVQLKTKKALDKFRNTDKSAWATDPTEVNAYHVFQDNTITIPLVMVQYPFYDLGLESLNYGSLGTIIGHEITHGFDNFGRKFDKNGNMVPWWSNATIGSYVNMTQCFVKQYSQFYVDELKEHVDGARTLGENIADNGGVREAFAALTEHRYRHGEELLLPGFEEYSPEQLFFLSYGNLWCGVSTKDSLKEDLQDEHTPHEFRARGALQNNDAFARAWNCPRGSKMNPADQCVIF
ncbi:endothelin-converting enzyme 2 isoform X1 [Plutella xylostella]|uniref:endothelin-converting enzyme 2 isoform X1 n=1 Tax=Plutella xylostella TaxID=51655 RepID=UPI00203228BF|nr:endothelin-converting enzyme 2 isoform X1 [Plutella xylostella]